MGNHGEPYFIFQTCVWVLACLARVFCGAKPVNAGKTSTCLKIGWRRCLTSPRAHSGLLWFVPSGGFDTADIGQVEYLSNPRLRHLERVQAVQELAEQGEWPGAQ